MSNIACAVTSRLVLHELFNRAALRGTYPPLLRAWGTDRSAVLAPGVIFRLLQTWDRLTGALDVASQQAADAAKEGGSGGEHKGAARRNPARRRDVLAASGTDGGAIQAPPGSFKGAHATSTVVATLLAMQVCEKVDLYGLAPPLAVVGRPSGGGATKSTYRFYYDRSAAHIGTLKKHTFDAAYEAFKALAAWPCSGVQIALHDPKPAA